MPQTTATGQRLLVNALFQVSPMQVTVGEGIGTANLTFTQGSDEICQLMQALVIHIVPPAATLSPVRPERRALGLPAKTEVCWKICAFLRRYTLKMGISKHSA